MKRFVCAIEYMGLGYQGWQSQKGMRTVQSEVELALNVHEALKTNNIESKVVSMPCQELFDKQSDDFKKDILDKESLVVTIEAGNVSSWKKYSGDKGISLGIDRFGESAPYKEIYEYLNLSKLFINNCIFFLNLQLTQPFFVPGF